jgi:uncharacterized protein (DUF3820 family)
MSLAIYDGLQFKAVDYKELACQMTEAFEHFEALARAHVDRFVVRRAAEIHDLEWWARTREDVAHPEKAFSEYLDEASTEWWRRLGSVRATREQDPDVEADVELACWPGPDGHYYGRVFSEVPGVREHLLESGYGKDFSYWNNADKPEELTSVEWDYRFFVWDEVYREKWGKACVFRTSPLYPYPVHPDNVQRHLPSAQQRARMLVRPWLYRQWLARESRQAKPGNLGGLVMEFMAELRTHSGEWARRYHDEVVATTEGLPDLALRR